MDFSKYTKQKRCCDTCEFCDASEDGEPVCSLALDEDEMGDFLGGNTGECHYYRYYDEYKSVHRQI